MGHEQTDSVGNQRKILSNALPYAFQRVPNKMRIERRKSYLKDCLHFQAQKLNANIPGSTGKASNLPHMVGTVRSTMVRGRLHNNPKLCKFEIANNAKKHRYS